MKILLAEDDLLQRKVLERVLTRAGHEVHTVTDGLEALNHVLAGRFSFLITDWDMPGIDGPTLCHRLRAAALSEYVYILMITGHTAEADLLAAFDAGADDYIRKPASEPELLARVKAGCRLIESERRLSAALAELHRLSVTDSLTGIYNRRYLNEQLARDLDRAHRYARPLSIVMADLDGFKLINDQHGHATGDEVLKCFADRLSRSVRASSDWIARYGGEEFVIVLPETLSAQATAVAEKLRSHCDNAAICTSTGNHRVTASFGIATSHFPPNAPNAPSTAEGLLRSADEALYRSKRGGRNCVTVASL